MSNLPKVGTKLESGWFVIGTSSAFGGSVEIGTLEELEALNLAPAPVEAPATVTLLVSSTGMVHLQRSHREGFNHWTACNHNRGVRGVTREGTMDSVTCDRCSR